ncbi:phenylacetate--CoA ligase family protein [Oceanihabitans sediminis]|uniref:Phenylacetate--CoA ligase family protein n=1 Tax=Oceanihabitans sediminis TaxID=1812012 RepID=A0A368P9C8_9FLAO|nr:phenylacetate--CoA ligase family protein [Oceanihabitans sediminis]RCU58920.1 phenylacetate--CoA ligase family protein [Oceanihabitans sediminis]
MNLFDLSLKLNGFPISKARLALEEIQNIKDTDFEAYIFQKRKEILDYHLQNNSFYKEIIKNADIKDWKDVPVMTKRDVQRPLEQRLSKGFSTKNVYISNTSGASGDPFFYAKDNFCHALTWSIIQNRFGWFDIDFNKSKQARFYGIPLDKKGYYKERLKDALGNRYRFSVFDLSDTAFEKCLEKFKKTPFDYINGYTSSIVQFAKFLKKKNLILTTVCPRLKACVVTSEMLFEEDKKLLEKQLNVPVINEYGVSEIDLIAFQNPEDIWQVNSETTYVEILDENDHILPYGEEGRIVVTSLYNKAHPFIRYDSGDIGILSKESTMQKPILEKLIGRTNDIAILPSGKKAAGLTFYYITKSIIEDDGKVREFIIEQHKIDTFKVIYASSEVISKDKIEKIKSEMENYLEKGLKVIFERQDMIKRSKSGKLKQFTSFIN